MGRPDERIAFAEYLPDAACVWVDGRKSLAAAGLAVSKYFAKLANGLMRPALT
jgi:hypothetical protein